jgi:hypothetical protein
MYKSIQTFLQQSHWQMPLLIFLSLSLSPSLLDRAKASTKEDNLFAKKNVHDKIKAITVPTGQNQVFSIKSDRTIKLFS